MSKIPKKDSKIKKIITFYVAFCLAEGLEPHKSYSGQLNIRIKPETHSRIAALAKQAGESINAFISKALDLQVAAML